MSDGCDHKQGMQFRDDWAADICLGFHIECKLCGEVLTPFYTSIAEAVEAWQGASRASMRRDILTVILGSVLPNRLKAYAVELIERVK